MPAYCVEIQRKNWDISYFTTEITELMWDTSFEVSTYVTRKFEIDLTHPSIYQFPSQVQLTQVIILKILRESYAKDTSQTFMMITHHYHVSALKQVQILQALLLLLL